MTLRQRLSKSITTCASAALVMVSGLVTPAAQAADHGDGPLASVQHSADIGDLYAFLDPNNSDNVIVGLTFAGFIVPGEAVNFGVFDDTLTFRFDFERTGDARADQNIQMRFSKKIQGGSTKQVATITGSGIRRFTADTTVANLSSTGPTPVITTNAASGIKVFAGVVDDPFFFDIPAFSRFTSSIAGGNRDDNTLNRGRDSFAGYSTLAIALSIPKAFFGTLPAGADNKIGVSARISRGGKSIDRMGNPAVNVALVPFDQKDVYNRGTTQQDASLRYATGIVSALQSLGTTGAATDPNTNLGILAATAVLNGDMLRLDLSNTTDGYPNGRRLQDDVIDTLMSLIFPAPTVTDNVPLDTAENNFREEFPFFGPAKQPFEGDADDLTRN